MGSQPLRPYAHLYALAENAHGTAWGHDPRHQTEPLDFAHCRAERCIALRHDLAALDALLHEVKNLREVAKAARIWVDLWESAREEPRVRRAAVRLRTVLDETGQ